MDSIKSYVPAAISGGDKTFDPEETKVLAGLAEKGVAVEKI